MLHNLTYQVQFARTGRSLSASLSFDKGMTTITGPNETGKSMVIEIIRWCLFGGEALRGAADDYASLTATLSFLDYRIDRTLKGGKLFKGDELLCTGTRPLNAKVLEILGFDLQVFDVACAANQGDIEKLASMKPTDRKRMVDRIIGADRIEELSRWCGEEALLVGREVSVLERGLLVPVIPTQPEGYRPTGPLQQQIEAVRERSNRLHELRGWLRNAPPPPTPPVRPDPYLSMGELEEAERILQLPVYQFDRDAAERALVAYDRWQERAVFESNHPRPSVSIEDVRRRQELEAYQDQLAGLYKAPVLMCPCGKPFRTVDEQIGDLESLIEEIGPVPEFDVREEARRHGDWSKPETLDRWKRVEGAVEVPEPRVSRAVLDRTLGGIHQDDLKARKLPVDSLQAARKAMSDLRTYEAHQSVYEAQRASYAAWKRQAQQVETEIAGLEVETAELADLESLLTVCRTYEQTRIRYEQDLIVHKARETELEERRAERTSWQNGKAGFNLLRDKIKSHLVPSLSRVASALLTQMTGGTRNSIVVDEEFEVTVDGQPLSTLSGSGKACANLALRIGLGQVLTNNMLSVFIGDEIDASMDADRSENIGTSLRMLSGRISQIIIVTHKIIQADHVIELGGSSGGREIHS